MTKSPIDEVLRRPAQHWSSDGLADLLAGVLLLLWGTAIAAQQIWPSRLTTLLAVGVPMVTALAQLVFYGKVERGLRALKARWIYPRVGYVKVAGPSRGRRAAAMLVSGVVAFLVAWIAVATRGETRWQAWLPTIMGVVCAAGFVLLWSRLGVTRLLVYAAAALAAGALAQWRLQPDLGVGAVLCSVGTAGIAGGSIVLSRLLRLPLAAEDRL